MSTLKLTVSNPNVSSTTLTRDMFKPTGKLECVVLSNYLTAVGSGLAQGSGSVLGVSNLDTQTQASGTVTCASVAAADTVTVGNIVFTAVSGTPTGNQFKRGVSDTADGLSLATAINANTSLKPYVVASNASGVVTLTSIALGALGNLLQLSSSNNTRLAVVGFASGVDAAVTSYSF